MTGPSWTRRMTFVEGLGAKMVCKQSGFENRGVVLVALLKDEAADGEVDEVGLALGTFLHGGLDVRHYNYRLANYSVYSVKVGSENRTRRISELGCLVST